MSRVNNKTGIKLVHRQWQLLKALLFFLQSMTLLAIVFLIIQFVYPVSYSWLIVVEALAILVMIGLPRFWKLSESDVSAYLNANYPLLEDSADLLFQAPDQGTVLEQWQRQKLAAVFDTIVLQHPFSKKLTITIAILCTVLLSIFLVGFFHLNRSLNNNAPVALEQSPSPVAGISSMRIKIEPPSYTGKSSSTQNQTAITAIEGSTVLWVLVTDTISTAPTIQFNDSTAQAFKPIKGEKGNWQFQTKLNKNGLYQIGFGKTISEHYPIELIHDLPPVINIKEPAAFKIIDYGASLQVPLRASIHDDYGITKVSLMLTVASGGGEAVKFQDQEKDLGQFGAIQLDQEIASKLNLQALKMQPGDELYYYLKAIDNHGQTSRSDIHIISLPDTAELMNTDIVINSLNLKPEFFRSQRQIIIETEQLLRDKDKMPIDSFKEKSNSLGIDQKLLRLRYGKFLGEESMGEIGAGEDHDEHEEHGDAVFGDASAIMDEFSHKHDNAEDASFFDPKTKSQLKAVLNEMWKSELQLRTFFPKEALPFEYKALRLLKDLQQQSRAYVAKTSQKTTPIKFEKRLTADLSKIVPPLKIQTAVENSDPLLDLRQGMGLLVQLAPAMVKQPTSMAVLQKTLNQLHQQAIAKPGKFLLSFEAMKRVVAQLQNGQTISLRDRNLAITACEQILQQASRIPNSHKMAEDGGLSQKYFHHLNSKQ
ncbi:MAG TPA: DUF4175 family protein [Sediminibacterium sp.]|nr:DUF4175 family protein [Sediminibacterium sp.]HQS54509.1 DUF4175 family protein [Sediminibacterium sp.]